MASVETTATSKPLWFGSAEGATEQVPVANGQADLSRSFKDGFDVKAISQVCQSVSPRLSTCQVKPKYPFFNCN
jgi:hypothetical protein